MPVGFRGTVRDRTNKRIDAVTPEQPDNSEIAPPTEPTLDPGVPLVPPEQVDPEIPLQPPKQMPGSAAAVPGISPDLEIPPASMPPPPLPNTSVQGTFAQPGNPSSLSTFRSPSFLTNRSTGNDPLKRFGPGDAALAGTGNAGSYEDLLRKLRGGM